MRPSSFRPQVYRFTLGGGSFAARVALLQEEEESDLGALGTINAPALGTGAGTSCETPR